MLATYEILVILMLGSFMGLIFTGFPIAWVLAGLAIVFSVVGVVGSQYLGWDTFFLQNWRIFGLIVQRIYAQMSNWVLVALPMFIFMGLMLERSGVAERLMVDFSRLLGRFPGGLALAVVVIGLLLAASTGIVGASVVLLAVLSVPIMLEQNYSPPFAVGVVAATGTLGILIPPSIMLIIMADQLSLSVGNLFMGAMIPGFMLGFFYLLFVLVAARVVRTLAPVPTDLPPVTLGLILRTLWHVVPPFFLILAVLGSIFFGIATPTEASGLGAFGATLLAFANKKLDLAVIREVCYKTSITTAFIFGIFLGATAFAVVLRQLGGDEFIAHMLNALPLPPGGIVLAILFFAFLAGFFLDWLEISLIILPLVAPVVAGLGFDLTWFVVLFAICLQTSFLTPPTGFSLFYVKGVVPSSITTQMIYKGVIPFIILQLVAVVVVYFWPELVLWLPRVSYG